MTLDEYEASLRADGTYQRVEEQRRLVQLTHEERVAKLEASLQPLTDELATIGIRNISSLQVGVDDRAAPWPAAIPILLKHLQRRYPASAKAVIAACLGVPEARIGWEVLVKEYENGEDEAVKTMLANALVGAVGEEVAESLMALAKNPANGATRAILLEGLLKLKDLRAKATIRELRNDPELRKAADAIVKKLNAKKH